MKKYLLMVSIFFFPMLVFASSGDNSTPIIVALVMEAFVSIHMSIFVLFPLSKIFSKDNYKKVFLTLFIIRAFVLLFFDFFITTEIAFIDFFAVFIGAFIIVPIAKLITIKRNKGQIDILNVNTILENMSSQNNQENILHCSNCGEVINVGDKFCSNCGVSVVQNKVSTAAASKVLVHYSDFDPIFNNTEDKLLEEFINRELKRNGIEQNNKLYPADILKRKNILTIIFSVLVFVYISLIFFHFPIYTYVVGFIILFCFFRITIKYNLMSYLKKEVKARPSEKISNIVMNVKNSFISDNLKVLRILSIIIACILPLIIFINPRIMYEKVEGGYAVRFYTFGLTNFKTASIPAKYNGQKVVSLRGNTFSNMPFLESVTLPNTITEIRGQAFKNDSSLRSVNIPINLEYLGGGAFYNCSSITSIELPDTLTYMGGEVFYGASSLSKIKLSENLMEIRGDSFEYCTSLRSIEIPDRVTRIGGHAFYGDTLLSEVLFTENSKLREIGSSAFRQCTSLYSITIPSDVYVNERAFKESPTSINYFDLYDEYYNSNY